MRMVLLFVFCFSPPVPALQPGKENAAVGNGGPPAEEKAAQPGGDSFSLERIEDWNFILIPARSQITRAEQVLDGYQGSFRNIEGEYRKFYDSIALQADERVSCFRFRRRRMCSRPRCAASRSTSRT